MAEDVTGDVTGRRSTARRAGDRERVGVRDPVRVLLVLTVLQQVPAGVALAAFVLTAQARGLDAGAVGGLLAVVAFGTAALELPTGGLADLLGRRGVLVAAAGLHAVAYAVLALAVGPTAFVVAALLLAAAGALASGPLEAWFVDEVAADPAAVGRGLALAGTATGTGLAAGGVLGGALALGAVAAGLPEQGTARLVALSVPMLLAAGLAAAQAWAASVLLRDREATTTTGSARTGWYGLVADLPRTVAEGARLAVTDPVLRWFSLRWLLAPVGFLALELLSPLRLAQLLDPARAAAVTGPLTAGCFLGIGVTAAAAPWLGRRFGALGASALVTVAAGVCFALAGSGGVVVLVAGVLLGFVASGPGNPLLAPLVHARVEGSHRATLLSVRSLVGNVAVGLAALGLGGVGEAAGTGWAFALAGGLTVLAALPLLGVAAARGSRRRP